MWNEYPNLVLQVADLHREATEIYFQVVWPQQATAGYAQTLYGYMHRVFGFIDTFSAYWKGTDEKQSPRMVDFMDKYLGANRRAHSIAVQIWRHKLVHTALPRNLFDSANGKTVHYLIQWHGNQMTPQQPHYTIVPFGGDEVFNVACLALIEDLQRATMAYVADLEASTTLQTNAASFAKELAIYTLRTI